MDQETNIFRHYKQDENRYTNGLISLLKLGSLEGDNLVNSFFSELADFKIEDAYAFKVLRGINGTADAEISGKNNIFLIETKIISGSLRNDQIISHLQNLEKYPQSNKKLILLTPDSINSNYIKQHIAIAPDNIIHINWTTLIQFFLLHSSDNPVFQALTQDYIKEIREDIFEQDIAAVIVKIKFGDESEVYSDQYINEFKNQEWTDWHTPKKYKELDGKGKKLILYDKNKGLVLEVEISNVTFIKDRDSYPWSNRFVMSTLRIYGKPILLSTIKHIPDINDKFRNFDKCSTSHWNLTRNQYDWNIKKNV